MDKKVPNEQTKLSRTHLSIQVIIKKRIHFQTDWRQPMNRLVIRIWKVKLVLSSMTKQM